MGNEVTPCAVTGCGIEGEHVHTSGTPGTDNGARLPGTAIMDYPTAWAFVKTTKPVDHHSKCSWRTQNGALLCDCDVLDAEYMRRKAKRRPQDGLDGL